jgi:hypothetical protein
LEPAVESEQPAFQRAGTSYVLGGRRKRQQDPRQPCTFYQSENFLSKNFTRRELAEIASHLSESRLSSYAQNPPNTRRALALYRWNAQISAAFIVPLHLCEVVTRNALAKAIEHVYGVSWFNDPGFARALPEDVRRELVRASRGLSNAGEIVATLKAFFWVAMLTSRHDKRLWSVHLRAQFPNLPVHLTIPESRKLLREQVDIVRRFRNRVAHHEPIFTRNLAAEYKRLRGLVAWRSVTTAEWLDSIQDITRLLLLKP